MSYTTQQDILDFVEDNNVKFVRFAFCDIFGFQKNIAVLASDLPKALEDGVCFDGSAIAGFMHVEESDLLLLFGSRELRTALFALFTGHVQLIFFYKKDRILAFTRSVMASAIKKDQSPALVLYRIEKMMLPVSALPRLKESELNALIG
mgnify:CR=1 FL=1